MKEFGLMLFQVFSVINIGNAATTGQACDKLPLLDSAVFSV